MEDVEKFNLELLVLVLELVTVRSEGWRNADANAGDLLELRNKQEKNALDWVNLIIILCNIGN